MMIQSANRGQCKQHQQQSRIKKWSPFRAHHPPTIAHDGSSLLAYLLSFKMMKNN
jgi:hypothetical protein